MVASKAASSKRGNASASQSQSQADAPKISPEEMVELLKEELSQVERDLVVGQVKAARETGKIPRALNSAIFVRSVLCRFRKAGDLPPPHIPLGAWQQFLLDSNATTVRNAMSAEQKEFWEYRTKVLEAHHMHAFPNYRYAPKHLPRAEKARRIEAANKLRATQGKPPLSVPRRGRPPKNAGTIEVPTVPAVPAVFDIEREVSPTSSSSDSFPMLSMSTPSTSSAASVYGNEFGIPFPLPAPTFARDDAAFMWDYTQAYRRSSQVALQEERGSKTGVIPNVDLPDFSAPQDPHQYDFMLSHDRQIAYGAGSARRTSVSEVVQSFCARRNSEFRFLPMPQQGYMHQEPMMVPPMPIQMPILTQQQAPIAFSNPFAAPPPQFGYEQSYQPSPLEMPAFQPQPSMLMTPIDESSSQGSDISPAFTNPFAPTGAEYAWNGMDNAVKPIPLDNGLQHLTIEEQSSQTSFYCSDAPDGLLFSGISTPPSSVHGDETPIDISLYA